MAPRYLYLIEAGSHLVAAVRQAAEAAFSEHTAQTIGSGAHGGLPDASTTGKGITRLSRAAADPANPIAVGENDPRLTPLAVANFEAAPASNQTVAASGTATITPLVLENESYDDGANFASSTFTAPRAGQYWLGGVCGATEPEVDSAVLLYVLLNGATGAGDLGSRVIGGAQASSTRGLTANGGLPFRLAAGATARLGVLYGAPTTTDTLVVLAARTRFYGHYMGV